MLKIIISADDSRKSNAAAQELVERAVSNPDKKFILMVPEQFSLQTQKKIVHIHPRGACMNIDILSFDRLAHVVLAKMGKDDLTILDDTGKTLILQSVLSDVKEQLSVYGSKTHLPGFVEKVKSVITEFKQYGIDRYKLLLMQESAAENADRLLESKLQDMQLILERFDNEIKNKYTTSEELLDILARELGESDFVKGADVYLDGFTGFTPVQYRLLERMLQVAENVVTTVLLPGELAGKDIPEYNIFHLSSMTFKKLQETASAAGCRCEVRCAAPPDEEKGRRPRAAMLEAPGFEEEVVFAAGQILHLVREFGYRFRDIALLTGDMELYHGAIRRIFSEAGIPVFVDHNEGIPGNVLVRFLLGALQMADENMSYDSVFSLIKTGLTNLTENEAAILENYCLEFNIRGRSKWNAPFSANRQLRKADLFAWDLELVNSLREKFMNQVRDFIFSDIRKNAPAKDKIKSLRKLLEKSRADVRIEALSEELSQMGNLALSAQYERITELMEGLFDKIDMLMGERPVSLQEFSEILTSGINEIKVGIIPPALDMVTAGDLMRTRLGDVKAIFIIGANDGKLPSTGSQTGIFTQKERELLKGTCDMAPTIREDELTQRFYIYQSFLKPSDLLYISWAGQTASGEEMKLSWGVQDILELAGISDISYIKYEPEVLWKEQALHRLAADIRNYVDESHRELKDAVIFEKEREEKVCLSTDTGVMEYLAASEPDALRKIIDGALFTNRQTPLDPDSALALYGEKLMGSVSRFEKFYECPYKHFLSYGLRLEKRPEYEIKVTDLGTIYHKTLELYSDRLREMDISFRNISDEESRTITCECVDEAIAGLGSDIFDSSARNDFLKNRVRQIAVKTTDILRDQVKAGDFEPDAYEFSFEEDLSDDIRFRGSIDRVDIYDSSDVFVKIIDYKSGNKKFSVEDIYSGLQLQLVAYLDQAVKKYSSRMPGRNVRPGGVYYYLINDKYEKADEKSANAHMLSGVTSSEGDVAEAVDRSLSEGGKSNIINVSFKKDGSMSEKSQVAGNDDFFSMMRFVNKRIMEAGERIRQGEVEIAPYHKGTKTGCTYCDYSDICRFSAGHFGTDWREACDMNKDMILKELFRHGEENE